ncbi:hypothetical protein FRX31_009197 [Thalictrum thalictroides]|uniref:Transmembrane protein n=1 Tax=Thalictrum thalictroides TaxID=46969 RepID=A0A7J6WUW9_THATH|nr:hypothetical protein FRX31_009197 [Thalictrum thalictroides]
MFFALAILVLSRTMVVSASSSLLMEPRWYPTSSPPQWFGVTGRRLQMMAPSRPPPPLGKGNPSPKW